ncbi:MAG: sodium:solute symporter family protein [Bacteroidota bacterium]
MELALLDIIIIFVYLFLTLFLGFYFSQKASKNMRAYFLAENTLNWKLLGLSNASGMFDISGTMWLVTLLFVYGLKSIWLPWMWPVWNQVFMMVFLAIWLRRSNVMTGAQWITFRFGEGRGAVASHIIVTIFAIISVLGFIAYFFVGIGKFATIFFPWNLSFTLAGIDFSSEEAYALLIMAITTLYVIKGGIYSVVLTEVLQFIIMTISCLAVGFIAFNQVSADQIMTQVPEGWDQLFFGWQLNLDWSNHLASVNNKIESDGFQLFGYLFMMMLFKGVFASLAGPVPSYDMQRVLSTKTPVEAAKMNGLTILALLFPRYLMIGGFAALALVYMVPELAAMGTNLDFEIILPLAIERFIPIGLKGLLLAGLLAAFMGTYAAFINAAPAYIVNDLYKNYINPTAADKRYVRFSYLASLTIVLIGIIGGFFAESINSLTLWISSALYGGYAMANVLKWIWWRFNGYGYFLGMVAGLIASTFVPPMFPDINVLYVFPIILLSSLVGCLVGTFATSSDDEEVLIQFYKQTRPWGWWQPIVDKIKINEPNFSINKDFKRDMFNVVVGIIWQTTLMLMPVYLVFHFQFPFLISLLVFLGTSLLLKIYWYDKLKDNVFAN